MWFGSKFLLVILISTCLIVNFNVNSDINHQNSSINPSSINTLSTEQYDINQSIFVPKVHNDISRKVLGLHLLGNESNTSNFVVTSNHGIEVYSIQNTSRPIFSYVTSMVTIYNSFQIDYDNDGYQDVIAYGNEKFDVLQRNESTNPLPSMNYFYMLNGFNNSYSMKKVSLDDSSLFYTYGYVYATEFNGKVVLIYLKGADSLDLYWFDKTMNFLSKTSLFIGAQPTSVNKLDYNHDNSDDLLITASNKIKLYEGDMGSLTLTQLTEYPLGTFVFAKPVTLDENIGKEIFMVQSVNTSSYSVYKFHDFNSPLEFICSQTISYFRYGFDINAGNVVSLNQNQLFITSDRTTVGIYYNQTTQNWQNVIQGYYDTNNPPIPHVSILSKQNQSLLAYFDSDSSSRNEVVLYTKYYNSYSNSYNFFINSTLKFPDYVESISITDLNNDGFVEILAGHSQGVTQIFSYTESGLQLLYTDDVIYNEAPYFSTPVSFNGTNYFLTTYDYYLYLYSYNGTSVNRINLGTPPTYGPTQGLGQIEIDNNMTTFEFYLIKYLPGDASYIKFYRYDFDTASYIPLASSLTDFPNYNRVDSKVMDYNQDGLQDLVLVGQDSTYQIKIETFTQIINIEPSFPLAYSYQVGNYQIQSYNVLAKINNTNLIFADPMGTLYSIHINSQSMQVDPVGLNYGFNSAYLGELNGNHYFSFNSNGEVPIIEVSVSNDGFTAREIGRQAYSNREYYYYQGEIIPQINKLVIFGLDSINELWELQSSHATIVKSSNNLEIHQVSTSILDCVDVWNQTSISLMPQKYSVTENLSGTFTIDKSYFLTDTVNIVNPYSYGVAYYTLYPVGQIPPDPSVSNNPTNSNSQSTTNPTTSTTVPPTTTDTSHRTTSTNNSSPKLVSFPIPLMLIGFGLFIVYRDRRKRFI